MQVFRVYNHKSKGYQAVPVGFSIGAFLASFLWAAANSLWGKAFVLFFGLLMMIAGAMAGAMLNMPLVMLSSLAGISLLPLWAGVQGQQWICDRFERQGYTLVKRISAESATHAINAAKRNEKKPEASQSKEPVNKPAATFGRDFRDVRDNAAPNSNQPPPKDFNASPWKRR